jgi:hypothetical protein
MGDFLMGIAYIIIDGKRGDRDFLFWMTYVRIDGMQGVNFSFLG